MKVLHFCFFLAALTAFKSAHADWIDFEKHEGIAYFLKSSPAQLIRYDLSTEQFLSDISLASFGVATAMEIDTDGIYVAFDRNLSRFDFNGANRINLSNAAATITDIVSSEFNVYAYYHDNVISVSKTNNQLNGIEDYFYSMKGLSYSRVKDRLFARNTGVSPSDILYIDLPDDGSQPTSHIAQTDSPYHGDYPSGSVTYLFPGEERVVDDAGIIYATDDLTYVGSFGGSFDHMDFYQGLPILLRDNKLLSFNAANIETGQASYPSELQALNIAVFGENVFGFSLGTSSQVVARKIAITALDVSDPGEPVNPNGLAYEPDKIIVGGDGIIYLLSSANLSIFRWSIATNSYLPTIPLRSVPKYMALSDENKTLYVAYSNGSITFIDLEGDLVEEGLVNLPTTPLGLETAGEYIFAVDYSGAWESHWTLSPTGEILSQKEWNYPSKEYIWNSTNRRFYHFRDGTSPNDLHWEEINSDGTIGAGDDSPYHSSTGIRYPIRVSPDGSRVVLGSGRLYDGLSLNFLASLANNIVDAIWFGDSLFTLKEGSSTTLQTWNPALNYDLTEEVEFSGRPLRLFKTALNTTSIFVLITELNGKPNFTILPLGSETDFDKDEVANLTDNCPFAHNPLQEDYNEDGTGDACETDSDADGVIDDLDNCVQLRNPSQLDEDENGIGDVCERDDDDDDLLLSLVPTIAAIAARNRLADPEWGVFNTLCCPGSTSTLTLTIDGNTSASTVPSCDSDATFNGYVNSEAGQKLVVGALDAAACGLFDLNFTVDFERAKRYLFAPDIDNGQITLQIIEFDISD